MTPLTAARRHGSDARLIGALNMSQLACGQVTITPSAPNTPTSVSVAFPAGLFPVAPFVVVSPLTGGPAQVEATPSGVSTSGFTITLQRNNTTATGVMWIAILPNSGLATTLTAGGVIDTSNFATNGELDSTNTLLANQETTLAAQAASIDALSASITTLAGTIAAGASNTVTFLDNGNGTGTGTMTGTTGVTAASNGDGTGTVTTDGSILTAASNGNGTGTFTTTSGGSSGGGTGIANAGGVIYQNSDGSWPARPSSRTDVFYDWRGNTDPYAAGVALRGIDSWLNGTFT